MHRILTTMLAVGLVLGTAAGLRAQAPAPAIRSGRLQAARGPRANLSTIQGNALTSSNGALASGDVRLRDARFGGIVDQQVTDRSGFFAFAGVDPGSYVVEIVAPDKTILAASQILNVNAGDTASAVVKLPFKISPFASVLSHTVQSALAVTAAAASSAVLAAAVTTDASGDRIRK
jgi:hypothetical protein